VVLPNNNAPISKQTEHEFITFEMNVLKRQSVWLNAGIIICAYKTSDNFGLFATQVLNMSQLDTAQMVSYGSYLRPIGAIAAGFLADRFSASKIKSHSFALLAFAFIATSFNLQTGAEVSFAIFNLMIGYLTIFALRAVYFALIEEQKIPAQQTGIVVGFV
jgi:nitrate/nitrite transporter NarK